MKSYYYDVPQLFKMPSKFSQGRSVLGDTCACKSMGEYQAKNILPYVATGIAAIVLWNMVRG